MIACAKTLVASVGFVVCSRHVLRDGGAPLEGRYISPDDMGGRPMRTLRRAAESASAFQRLPYVAAVSYRYIDYTRD